MSDDLNTSRGFVFACLAGAVLLAAAIWIFV